MAPAAAVDDLDPAVVQDCLRDGREVRRVLGVVVPGGDVEVEAVLQPAGPVSLVRCEGGQQLELGRTGLPRQAERGGRPGHADEEKRRCLLLG